MNKEEKLKKMKAEIIELREKLDNINYLRDLNKIGVGSYMPINEKDKIRNKLNSLVRQYGKLKFQAII